MLVLKRRGGDGAKEDESNNDDKDTVCSEEGKNKGKTKENSTNSNKRKLCVLNSRDMMVH